MVKTIIFPRQARDKHRENANRHLAFSYSWSEMSFLKGAGAPFSVNVCEPWLILVLMVRQNAFLFRIFIAKTDHFSKTGSGQA